MQSGAHGELGWLPGPWGHSAGQKPKPRAQHELREQHCFLCPRPPEGSDPQEFTHFSVALWSPTDRTQSWGAAAPKADPCDLREPQSTECSLSPIRGGASDSCPCCKTCLTNWQGQNTAPARKQEQQGPPGHPHWSPAQLTKERGSSESQNSSQVGNRECSWSWQGQQAHNTPPAQP